MFTLCSVIHSALSNHSLNSRHRRSGAACTSDTRKAFVAVPQSPSHSLPVLVAHSFVCSPGRQQKLGRLGSQTRVLRLGPFIRARGSTRGHEVHTHGPARASAPQGHQADTIFRLIPVMIQLVKPRRRYIFADVFIFRSDDVEEISSGIRYAPSSDRKIFAINTSAKIYLGRGFTICVIIRT